MKTNTPRTVTPKFTANGAVASNITAEQELRRLTAACMLWEQNFYESGTSVTDRIAELIPLCRTEFVAACAIEARSIMHLRHVPLLIVREMARTPKHQHVVAKLLYDVIQRADELAEFVAIYWKDGRQSLSAQVKKGLAKAFTKFNAYNLAKYNRNGAVKLRDVAFLCHVRPWDGSENQAVIKDRKYVEGGVTIGTANLKRHTDSTLAKLINNELPIPNTWETRLSAGEDKKTVFTELMAEKQLGALAFLRNLRNMDQAGVSRELIRSYSQTVNTDRVLPFRYIAAARTVPGYEDILEPMMLASTAKMPKLKGRTTLMVDVSGSMNYPISDKSDLRRVDAAIGLAILLREVCEDVQIVTFSDNLADVPPRRGFALGDAIVKSQRSGGTHLGKSLKQLTAKTTQDRLIVITDEQSSDRPGAPPAELAYVINVASNRNGVGYGAWKHIDGWSEAVITYIQRMEELNLE